MAVPAAKYLVRFDMVERDLGPEAEPKSPVFVLQSPPVETESERDDSERIEEAYRRGKEEGSASARETFEIEHAQERQRFEEEMDAARSQWMQEVVERLAQQIPAAFDAVETRIADSISRVLRPAILAAVRQEVTASLADTLTKLRSGEGGRLISISGPDELLASLRERLSDTEQTIEFLSDRTIEVKVVADQTIVESQIQAWSSILEASAG